jgi:hypothetical protein
MKFQREDELARLQKSNLQPVYLLVRLRPIPENFS